MLGDRGLYALSPFLIGEWAFCLEETYGHPRIVIPRLCSEGRNGERPLPISSHSAVSQPPPLRGTSFHRKEGVSTRAPSLGRGCRAQQGGVGFLFGRRSGAFVNGALETIFFALFHTARTLSGSLCSPPSPRGEGFVGGIVFSHMHVFALTIWG